MNVLFANYGDFATNSTSHIAGFANALAQAGHACVFAVPWGVDTVRLVPEVKFRAAAFHECLNGTSPFPNGQPADVLHAWTPRELVREFAVRYCAAHKARLVVHLEDNEDYLFAAGTGLPLDDLLGLDEDVIRQRLAPGLSHPRRARLFLRAADAVSTIVPTLRSFVPPGVPTLDLPPGVDFGLFHPMARVEGHRRSLGLRDGERCIVYTGSTSFANASETRDLYEAVGLLNRRGVPTRLIRTGADSPAFAESIPHEIREHIVHLGFIPRVELPALLAEADVLVQPGRPGAFNNFRLPSKVPEFLAVGRPVIVPASNIGLELVDEREAVVLDEATPVHIADACARIMHDRALGERLAENAAAFARQRFDGAQISRRLADLYRSVCSRPPREHSAATLRGDETELSLGMRSLAAATRSRPDWADTADLAELLLPLVHHLDRPSGQRADLRRVEAERDEWHDHFENAREHASNLELRISELVADLEALKLQRAVEIDQLRQAVAQREEKIDRMSATFSWKLTMPLRAARRVLGPKRRRSGDGA
ncbi:MAG: glycosyltransferase family 4 protein [Opitutaceae bacterium]|nr:glycosyltransferase family 4 protein [Opitutaceae bacterium]